jgi:glutathione S-transferase
MKLYYSPGACSLSPHIVLREAGLAFEPVLASTKTHKLQDGTDYYTINPKGYVPVLELDDGQRLTELAVILQYIADRNPGTLAPEFGSLARYRLMEWLNFIATEIHKGWSPLWRPNTPDAYKAILIANVAKRFDLIEPVLATQSYLTGNTFTIADAYLFTIVNWHKFLKLDIAKWPALEAFQARVAARPKVHEALQAEHLIAAAKAA